MLRAAINLFHSGSLAAALWGRTAPAIPAPRVAGAPSCERCHGAGIVFDCAHWPRCGCPGGAVADHCPGRTVACSCRERANG